MEWGWHFVHSIVELRWSNKGGRLASVCLTLKHTVADCLTFERDILVTHIALIFSRKYYQQHCRRIKEWHCIDGIGRSIGTIFYPLWLNCTTFTSASWKDIVISLPPFSPLFGLLGLPSGLRVSFHCGRNSTTTALYYTFPAYRRVVGWQGGLRWYQYGRLEDTQYYWYTYYYNAVLVIGISMADLRMHSTTVVHLLLQYSVGISMADAVTQLD